MTAGTRPRLGLAQALCVLAVLISLAGSPRAFAAQTLMLLGAPVTLAGDGGEPTAESPVDGSFELAMLQSGPTIPFLGTATLAEVIHYGSDGRAGPGVNPGSSVSQDEVAVAALQQGGFVTAWVNVPPFPFEPAAPRTRPQVAGDLDTVSVRLLDGSGQPAGAEIQVSPSGTAAAAIRLGALSSGGFVASWLQDSSVALSSPALMATMFSATGEALTGPIAVGPAARNFGVVGLGDGGFIAAWGGPGGAGIFWQRFNAAGTALAPAVEAVSIDAGGPVCLAANPTGQLALSWMTTNPFVQPLTSVLVQMYSTDGSALAPPAVVASSLAGPGATIPGYPLGCALAVNLQGQALVAWKEAVSPNFASTAAAFVQLLDTTGALSGTPLRIGAQSASPQVTGLVAENNGDWSARWTDLTNTYVQKLSSASCSPSALSLCLDDNRFRLDLQFTDPQTGGPGIGNPVPLSDGTGALWFFDPSIPEVVAKVIDGTTVNGHFWVFFASLTNVEFDLTVADTKTGAQRIYHNPAGTLASQADTSFPTGSAARPDAGPAAREAAIVRAPSPSLAAKASSTQRVAAAEAVCNSSEQALCLLGSEFAATVTFRETAGSPSGSGQAVQLSADGGYYWFFGPNDAELVVKILDGRAVNGHIWVFYASLTDVEFDLTVTDSFSPTHATRTYHNPAGTLASAADTSAF